MVPVRCRAKDKSKCRIHGIPTKFTSLNMASQEILDEIQERKVFLINRAQRIEKIRKLYTVDSFMKPEEYSSAVNDWDYGLRGSAKLFYQAESRYQHDYLEQNLSESEFKEVKTALKAMTANEKHNIVVRNDNAIDSFSTFEGYQQHNAIIAATRQAFAVAPTRQFENRLFRGFKFQSEQDYQQWFKNNVTVIDGKPGMRFKEFVRTSAQPRRAWSFAQDKNYPVLFEVVSKSGLYLDKLAPYTNQEQEVLFNANTNFTLENTFETEVKDHDLGGIQRKVRVLQLSAD